MYVLVIEFDRLRGERTSRERRLWVYERKNDADIEAARFTRLAHAGSIQFLRNGDRVTFQECRLYSSAASDPKDAAADIASGKARLLQHAFNPALSDPGYWETVLEKLDNAESLG